MKVKVHYIRHIRDFMPSPKQTITWYIRKGYNISFVCRAADNFNVIKHIINLNQTRFPITTNQTIAFKAYEYKKELHIFYIDCLRK